MSRTSQEDKSWAMLRIRQAQIDAFEAIALENLPLEIVTSLRNSFSAAIAGMPEEALAIRVREAIRKARSHGLERNRDVEIFVILMFAIGWQFDEAEPFRTILLSTPSWQAIGAMFSEATGAHWAAAAAAVAVRP